MVEEQMILYCIVVFLLYRIPGVPFTFVQDRENELEKEARRQDYNDELRQTFAEKANTFHKLLTETR